MNRIRSFLLRYKRHIIVVVLLVVASYVVSIGFTLGSDAYKVAKEYVQNSEELKRKLGTIDAVGFTPRAGLSYSGGRGEAFYYLNVASNGNVRQVYIELTKVDKTWEVTKARIID